VLFFCSLHVFSNKSDSAHQFQEPVERTGFLHVFLSKAIICESECCGSNNKQALSLIKILPFFERGAIVANQLPCKKYSLGAYSNSLQVKADAFCGFYYHYHSAFEEEPNS
jgi:hypothetical protein